MEILGAVATGVLIGSILGLIGAGGAMITIPILIYGFDFKPSSATTAALAIVLSTAIAALIHRAKQGEILYKEGLVIWSLGLSTNLAASIIAHKLPDQALETGVAIIMFAAGYSLSRKSDTRAHTRISTPYLVALSLVIGLVTGFFGIGGGFIVIPVLVLAFGTPVPVAAGTSLFVIAINSLTALIGHFQSWDEVSWTIPAFITATALVVATVASRLQEKVDQTLLKKSFTALLYGVAIFTLIQAWFI